MANILKARARKPVIENGRTYTGNSTAWGKSDTPGFVQAQDYLYTLTVVRDGVEYSLQLSEDEMLGTTTEWMKSFMIKRAQDKRNAQRSA